MSSRRQYSDSWYRVSGVKPRLRSHAVVHRHTYRGQTWYLLQDQTSGRYHRFSADSYKVIALMNGERSLQEIWEIAAMRLKESSPTQDEVIQILAELYAAGALYSDVMPDIPELLRRTKKEYWKKVWNYLKNPLAVRLPLIDPDRFVEKAMPYVAPLLSIWAGVIWFITILFAIALAVIYWDDLSGNMSDQILSMENMLMIGLLYPVIKIIHEFGHAFTVKKWGGDVHEMGLMFLILMPIPYVDASSSASFRNKYKRISVSLAGVVVELFIAAIALFIWVAVEPGLVRAMAFNTVLIASVSTLLFNLNPLLRFDGYFAFSDALEIPNMAQRSNKYIAYLIQYYLFNLKVVDSPVTVDSERGWLFFYAIAAFIYRLFIIYVIVLLVAAKFYILGIILAAWALMQMFFLPVFKSVGFVLFSPAVDLQRTRAVLILCIFTAFVSIIFAVVPVPSWTRAEAVVWAPEGSRIYAKTDGFILGVEKLSHQQVKAGDVLIRCSDISLQSAVVKHKAKERELMASYSEQRVKDLVQAKIIAEQLKQVRSELAELKKKESQLQISSDRDGQFLLADAEDLPGRYVHRGDLLGYVVNFPIQRGRVMIAEDRVDLIRKKIKSIEVKRAGDISKTYEATLVREVPTGSKELPHMAFAIEGGGNVGLDPSQTKEPTSLHTFFQFDLALPKEMNIQTIGDRLYVRFNHGNEPLFTQVYRSLRQVILRQLNA